MKELKRKIVRGAAALGASIVSFVVLASGVASAQSITLTGPGSFNSITTTTTTTTVKTNTNIVGLTNFNTQTALSGPATSMFNTIGGPATSGAASNWASSWYSVYINNL